MRFFTLLLLLVSILQAATDLHPAVEVRLESPVGQMRAVPVQTAPGAAPAMLIVYGADVEVDPYHEMFFYPKGTLNLALIREGRIVWKRDLGPSVVPGIWFCPVFPFDLNGDGSDEIWFVNNTDADHPLSLRGQRLERLDSRTGKSMGTYPWPAVTAQSMSHTYRNFILGGQVRGTPVLVTAQGTYGPMALQAWNVDMRQRWEVKIPGGPGPRGSHMSPVVDFDNDGVEEVLWGERRIELDAGKQIACGDCNRYNGHSDVIQPFLDWTRNRWFTFTCRENDPVTSPRVAVFDPEGARIWGDVDRGHMDVGWVAHLDPQSGPVAMSLRIGTKSLGPGGLARTGVEEFVWEAISGKPRKLGFSVEGTYPVDINGDGFHELIRQGTGRESEIIDAAGNRLANFSGTAVCTSKLLKLPGEQIAAFTADGIVRIWTDRNAVDSARALKRYAHPYYRANARLSAAGYNVKNLGGL